MDNVLIFIISVGLAGLLFTAFSEMVKRSARAHAEEEERERRRESERMLREQRMRKLHSEPSHRSAEDSYSTADYSNFSITGDFNNGSSLPANSRKS